MYFRFRLSFNCILVYCITHSLVQGQNETTPSESEEKQLLADLEHMKTASIVAKEEEERRKLTSTTFTTEEPTPIFDGRLWWQRYPPTTLITARPTFPFSARSVSKEMHNQMNTTTRSTPFRFTKPKHDIPERLIRNESTAKYFRV